MNKVLRSLFLSVIVFVALTPYVSAFNYLLSDTGYQYRNADINTCYVSNYPTQVFSGVGAWGSTYRKMVLSNTSQNYVYEVYYSDSFLARWTSIQYNNDSINRTIQYTIKMNTRTLAGKSYNFIKSVFVHECGHALGLADNNDSSSYLMSHTRNRENIYSPQTYDINAVYQHSQYF